MAMGKTLSVMVKLNRIYTRSGDDGTAALADGSRRPKDDARFMAIGEVDEANAAIGIARLHVAPQMAAHLEAIQNDLFDLGADLATPGAGGGALRITPAQVRWLEERIDALNADLAPLRSFVLPGGSAAAAHLHLARAICRRAERAVAALAAREPVGPQALAYVNRLSDYLFVAARHANAADGCGDVLWTPGEGRGR